MATVFSNAENVYFTGINTQEDKKDDDDEGPSVDSNDADERIAARRLRIARRIEHSRRAALGQDGSGNKDSEAQLSGSRKQMEESRLRLTKLRSDGLDLITNICVASDARESNHRLVEEEVRRIRKEKLEQEAKSSAERFEEISKKWEVALQKDIPQSLHEMLLQQKRLCDTMNDDKNKLITEFQQELKSKDDLYVKDLKMMAEDVDLMIERMDDQIGNVMRAHQEELKEIERAFVAERNELLEKHKKSWEERMSLRSAKEEECMDGHFQHVEDNERQLQSLRVQDAEDYNTVKIRLETDVQTLEQQLQQMRATYQLNQEKLEYNFQVLKKRDEENTITKSQQKRKITRMQDALSGLRQKSAKQEKAYRDDNVHLTEDYRRVTEQFQDLQQKAKRFMAIDSEKFRDVWCMNEEECKDLASKIIACDRIIQQQQLGLPWTHPDTSFMDNVGPISADVGAGRRVSALQIAGDALSLTDQTNRNNKTDNELSNITAAIFSKMSAEKVKRILELLCDESGFLVEARLCTLLQPLKKDDQSLMKLDAIFTALMVEKEEDIYKLSSYFTHPRQLLEDSSSENGDKLDSTVTGHQETDAGNVKAEDGDDEDTSVPKCYDETVDGWKDESLLDLVHPNEVLKALRAFMVDHHPVKREKAAGGKFHIGALSNRDSSGDAAHWLRHTALLTVDREKVWDALLAGLDKYNGGLNARCRLLSETEELQTQNSELRMLLHQYVNSTINAELHVPPTRLPQLDPN